MTKDTSIMACLDFSDYSLMTLEAAVMLARALDARILVINVFNQRDIYALETSARFYPPKKEVSLMISEMVEDRYNALRKLIRDSFPEDKSRMTLKVEIGIPSEVIMDTAEAQGVDLIVMANKGRGNLSRVLFGSVAEKVLRHSKITVVSVRDKERFTRKE